MIPSWPWWCSQIAGFDASTNKINLILIILVSHAYFAIWIIGDVSPSVVSGALLGILHCPISMLSRTHRHPSHFDGRPNPQRNYARNVSARRIFKSYYENYNYASRIGDWNSRIEGWSGNDARRNEFKYGRGRKPNTFTRVAFNLIAKLVIRAVIPFWLSLRTALDSAESPTRRTRRDNTYPFSREIFRKVKVCARRCVSESQLRGDKSRNARILHEKNSSVAVRTFDLLAKGFTRRSYVTRVYFRISDIVSDDIRSDWITGETRKKLKYASSVGKNLNVVIRTRVYFPWFIISDGTRFDKI